jgi:predicted amidohydrolase
MRVAGLQMDIAWEDPAENFLRAGALARRAAEAGANLLVLPEMFATGFTMDAEAAAVHAAGTREFLAGLAGDLAVFVAGGYVEPGAGLPSNTCALFSPGGREIARYHKIHPFSLAGEHEHYAAGESLVTAAIEGVRVTPVICYDLRFPELFRAAAEETDLFLVIANWPERRGDAWRTLLRARAMENQCFVLGVNRVGEGSGQPHRGDTALLDPFGREIDSASFEVAVVQGDVDAATVAEAREHFGFLADRRPDLYRRLEGTR